MLDGLAHPLDDSRFGDGHPEQATAGINHVDRALAGGAEDAAQGLGAPEPSNMLWLVQHATVRANKPPVALDVPLPPKKRAAAVTARIRTAWA